MVLIFVTLKPNTDSGQRGKNLIKTRIKDQDQSLSSRASVVHRILWDDGSSTYRERRGALLQFPGSPLHSGPCTDSVLRLKLSAW